MPQTGATARVVGLVDPALGLRLGSSVFAPLIKRLFRPDGPGAGLVERPVRISSLVSFTGERRTVGRREVEKLSDELVRRAVRELGPHDALSAGEESGVAAELARSLRQLGRLEMDDAQAVRWGHERLARELDRSREHTFELSPGAHALYTRLLEAACLHILNFFTQRSTFVARTLVEQSRQLDRLAARADLLIERVPPQSAGDAAFEERYARHIISRHSLLTIYGIDLHHAREWPLDAAYLSLEATERQQRDVREGDEPPPQPQLAERALAGRNRVLLRGVAGSGKTTLVQWLAVATARQDAGEDTAHLLGRVPFVLPMRTLTRGGKELPPPAGFLSAVGTPHTPPDGWAERVLTAGRGLLLIDGIDEIPEQERERTRRWLRELLGAFPGNLWLVTARPSAVREGWLTGDDFSELSLARMGPAGVATFIQRWHQAAQAGPEYENKLLAAVRTKPDLGRLVTNPLMCGLICALHRERRGYLPRGRKALYDAALLMLLERRDRERDMGAPSGIDLDAESQSQLLQKLAYWLIRNGRSEMDRSVAVELLERVLPLMPQVGEQGTAAAVYRHLLDRSGLLREPAPGTMDFIHRTFQDFLGAREAVEERDFPLLVEKAHLDQWEDVIRMAVAHCRAEERARLLVDLIRRGDREPEDRIRLHLLAMACLEHATQLDPAVRELVERRAGELIPPRTGQEAESLAAVGPVVLELLPGPEGLTDQEAHAVVYAAAEIGGDAALPSVTRFLGHRANGVLNRLAWGWPRFDTQRYAEEVIRHFPSDTGHYLVIRSREEGRVFQESINHPSVHVQGDFSAREITSALAGKHITRLSIRDNHRIADIGFLSAFPDLEYVALVNCAEVDDLGPLAGRSVEELLLDRLPRLESLDPLNTMPRLGTVLLRHGLPAQLPRRARLRAAELPPKDAYLAQLPVWPRLRHLSLGDPSSPDETRITSVAPLDTLPELGSLSLRPALLDTVLVRGTVLAGVTSLRLRCSGEDISAEGLPAAFPALRELRVSYPGAVDLGPLAALDSLRAVSVDEARRIENSRVLPGRVTLIADPPSRY